MLSINSRNGAFDTVIPCSIELSVFTVYSTEIVSVSIPLEVNVTDCVE